MTVNSDSTAAMDQAFEDQMRQYFTAAFSSQQIAIQNAEGMKQIDLRAAIEEKQALLIITLLCKLIEIIGQAAHKAEQRPHDTSKDASINAILEQSNELESSVLSSNSSTNPPPNLNTPV